jgi:hypothetical protein
VRNMQSEEGAIAGEQWSGGCSGGEAVAKRQSDGGCGGAVAADAAAESSYIAS